MKPITEIIDEVIGDLPEEDQESIAEHVVIRVRARPEPQDLERGATPDHAGYFYGYQLPVDDADREDMFSDEPLGGEIVIFTENIRPFDEEHIRRTLLHELSHFLGKDEDEIVSGMGL